MIPAPETNYSEIAVGNLIDQFRKPNISALASIFAARWQLVENAIQGVIQGVLAPYGIMLDSLGSIVGLQRQGLDDADYAGAIYVQILVLRSRGLANDLQKIGTVYLQKNPETALPSKVIYNEFAPASADMTLWGVRNPGLIASFLGRAKPAGRRLIVAYEPHAASYTGSEAQPFVLDYNGTLGTTGLGYLTDKPRYALGSFLASSGGIS